ncbi:hypothetical protein ACFQWC_13530 [Rossellomorea sp. GCM10028870]|uniref:hypothetical protein n=1 Tax=Rossellomorea sp. GCM10028870 TaxID=3273426 RepID=UPI00361FB23D
MTQQVVVYYQEQPNLNTEKVLQRMKKQFDREDWILSGLYIDHIKEYDNLLEMITELGKVDMVYLYSKDNIEEDFYWNMLRQTAKIEKVSINIYIDI